MNSYEIQQLNNVQETILHSLFMAGIPQMESAKLLGGTALARCYLQHRISYDLDVFLPEAFEPRTLLSALQRAGVSFQTKCIVDKNSGCVQVHGVSHGINVSFIEDKFFELFPPVRLPLCDASIFPDLRVTTESIDGLYHRKLVCIAGDGTQGTGIVGRQKARDIFDIYALSTEYKSLPSFIPSLPYSFPVEQFIEAFTSIHWHEILPEMAEILPTGQYCNVSLANMEESIIAQLDMIAMPDDTPEEGSDDRGMSPC